MSFQKKRFTFEADEANFLRLQMLTNKSFITSKDFQSIISALLQNATRLKK